MWLKYIENIDLDLKLQSFDGREKNAEVFLIWFCQTIIDTIKRTFKLKMFSLKIICQTN